MKSYVAITQEQYNEIFADRQTFTSVNDAVAGNLVNGNLPEGGLVIMEKAASALPREAKRLISNFTIQSERKLGPRGAKNTDEGTEGEESTASGDESVKPRRSRKNQTAE